MQKTHSLKLAWLICILAAIFYCYEYLLRIAPSVMSTQLMQAYDLTATQFGNLTAYYYYIYTPMQILVGILFDRFGTRILLTLACLICALGTYLFSCGDSIAVAAFGRLLVGLGSSFAFVGSLKLITIWLPERHFALGAGTMAALGSVGAITGDIILTSLVDSIGWRQASVSAALVGVVLAVILGLFIQNSPKEAGKEKPYRVPFNTILTALWESLKTRQIWLTGIVGCLMYLPISTFGELWAIPYLQQARGLSPHDAAAAASMTFFGWMIGCPLSGFISDHFRNRLIPMFIGAISCLLFLCIFLYVPDLSFNTLRVLFVCLGMSGSVQALVFSLARESSRPAISATAIALMNMLVMVGGVVFQPVIGMLLDLHWAGQVLESGVRVYNNYSFVFALSVLPLGVILSMITIFFIKETHGKIQSN